jgi:hypothetical protein
MMTFLHKEMLRVYYILEYNIDVKDLV